MAASGSVALLADGLHNLGDVFTTVTLWIPFLVGKRRLDRGRTFGFARVEDVAGVLVVLAIAASAVIAAAESLVPDRGGAAAAQPRLGAGRGLRRVAGNEAVARGPGSGRAPDQLGPAGGRRPPLAGRRAGQSGRRGQRRGLGGWPAADPLASLLLSAVIAWVLVGTTRDVLARLLDRVDPDVIDQVERAAGSVAGSRLSTPSGPAGWAALHVLVHAGSTPTCPCGTPTPWASRPATPSSTPSRVARSTCTWTRPASTSTTATARPCTTGVRACR